MLMPAEGFAYTKGAPKTYMRPDKADAVAANFPRLRAAPTKPCYGF